VSLALQYQREVVWGAVFDPERDELFTAEKGKGAFLNGDTLRVSDTRTLDKALVCTGFPYDVHDSAQDNLDHFGCFVKTARAVRRDGSAALDLCYVGAGRFDGFWEMKLKPWDLAAGALIVAEAGGSVSTFDGAPYCVESGNIVASNALLHEQMIQIIGSAGIRVE
jgi:myo-inositol-1(or 4)-monophosphatase